MAFVTTQNLCAGMVVARNLLDRNQRILLKAGVALSESHIRALHSLGIPGLEIRGLPYSTTPVPAARSSHTASIQASKPEPRTPAKPRVTKDQAKIESTLRTLKVTRTASKPLRPRPEPAIASQSEALMNHLLKGTSIARDSALATVVQLYTLRLLRMKSVKKQAPAR